MTGSPVFEHRDLGLSVAEVLKQLIFSGGLLPGERLVETELADRFGTSRGPIRDALTTLEQSGLVTSRPRRGTVVRELTVADVEEVYTLRIALESLAVRLLVEVGDEPAAGLWELLDVLDAAHAAGDRLVIGIADMDFHRAIVRNCGHRRLLDAWERLADQTILLMAELSSLDPVIQGPTGDHRSIVERLAERDGAGADAALVRHLTSAMTTVVAHWSHDRVTA